MTRQADDPEVAVVVGAQYGSEGKGNICSHLADRFGVHVRTGGPNAGHSHRVNGETFKQQVIPVGWANPDATLVVGRGALVDLETLAAEAAHIEEHDPAILERLIIDADAGVLEDRFEEIEGGTEGELHDRIGSTGEGVGAARKARISRDPSRFRHIRSAKEDLDRLSREHDLNISLWSCVAGNTPGFLEHVRHGSPRSILVEGTQGSGLSLIHGPWPYATSADTNASAFASEAGIPPHAVEAVIAVARTYPIRVGGNSGPLKNELTWEEMAERTGKQVDEIVERTTVTDKIRRIAEWDEELVRKAVTLNDPTSFALNFVDYLSPEDEGKTDVTELSDRTIRFIRYLETTFDTPVSMVGTGGEEDWQVIDTAASL